MKTWVDHMFTVSLNYTGSMTRPAWLDFTASVIVNMEFDVIRWKALLGRHRPSEVDHPKGSHGEGRRSHLDDAMCLRPA